ncbi:hypothetical protein [Lewinella sp. LCG006]|uniref:hypothetical protein n=1 Tax=Lewinella sp. LCG006 TaxID=3231911 RepID=UPI003461096E
MAKDTGRYTINALDAYVISGFIRKYYSIPFDKPLTKEHVINAAESARVDPVTLGKYCGVHMEEVRVARTTLDKIVRFFSKKQFETWGEVSEIVNDTVLNQNIPYGYNLPEEKFFTILSKGKSVLAKIFPDIKIEDSSHLDGDKGKITRHNGNIKQYLNTLWYAYFYYPYGRRYGQIIRTVIHIGDSPEKVNTYSPSNPKLDDFFGSVAFDKGEMVLNYNMTTRANGRRWLHLKQYVHGGDNIPEVTLGEYLNVGNGGFGLHNIRLIMELQAVDCQSPEGYEPKIYHEGDPDFHRLPNSYKRYLRFQRDNYREISTRGTYTLDDLEQVVQREKKNRFYSKDIRLTKKFQVYISFPRYSLPEDEYKIYHSALTELKDHWEEKYPLEIMEYCLKKPSTQTSDRFHFISDKILEADIFIGLFYNNGSISVSEITIAAEQGKYSFGFYSDDTSFIPQIFTSQWPQHVCFFWEYKELKDAINYLKDDFVITHLAKNIDHYNNITESE